MLSGQADALRAHIATLTTAKQVSTMINFVHRLDDYSSLALMSICLQKLDEVTSDKTAAEHVPKDS